MDGHGRTQLERSGRCPTASCTAPTSATPCCPGRGYRRVLWSFPTGGTVEYAPVVADRTLYPAGGPNLHALARCDADLCQSADHAPCPVTGHRAETLPVEA
ncbi:MULTISPECIES: PQQ-binding-like beta-propeller repeat protein [Streptomyces]|uniref:PQQ-binding-like beta-propeller repeat protein n=1 Tax=Streptomyces TaxID=1883 RepID=UPI0036EB6F60